MNPIRTTQPAAFSADRAPSSPSPATWPVAPRHAAAAPCCPLPRRQAPGGHRPAPTWEELLGHR